MLQISRRLFLDRDTFSTFIFKKFRSGSGIWIRMDEVLDQDPEEGVKSTPKGGGGWSQKFKTKKNYRQKNNKVTIKMVLKKLHYLIWLDPDPKTGSSSDY
jgi:hypothetical protein